jgi:hypothetical protein
MMRFRESIDSGMVDTKAPQGWVFVPRQFLHLESYLYPTI